MDREFIEGLEFTKQIGSGGFSEVYLATATEDGEQYVVKALSKEKVSEASAIQEVFVGQLLCHTNISRHVGHFHDEENYYLLYDYRPGKQLFIKVSSNVVFSRLRLV